MKKIKYFIFIILAAFTALVFSSAVCAESAYSFDTESKCSIHFSLIPNDNKNDAVRGAEVTIYRVADLNISNGKYTYDLCGGFENCGYDIDNPDNPRLAWWLYTFAVENRLRGTSIITDKKGEATFKDLEPGLYLGAETMSVKNYCDFSPFLLSLPMAEDDRWIYNVSAAPKIEIERFVDITVSKYWNDNGNNRPESIRVQLYSDDGVYDTVTLDSSNDWSYTWEMIQYTDSWAVKELNVPNGYTVTYEQEGMNFSICNTGNNYTTTVTNPGTAVTNVTGVTTVTSGTTGKPCTTGTAVTSVVTGSTVSTTVTTGSSSTLIQTGQLKWPVPVLICCGLLFITAGTMVISGGGNENKR